MAAPPSDQPNSPPQPDTRLKPLIVTDERPEEATGPVSGYVARRSASGTKTDTPIIEIPQSISVIGRPQMEAQAVDTVGSALRYTPGVTAEQFGGAETRQDFFMVRGFAQNFPFVDGLNTQTYFSVLAPSIDTYGLERVEVLRGPASVLYGQSYPGGLINLVTKKPTAESLHEFSLEGGNYGRVGGRFDSSGSLTKDGTLLYRLTGDAVSSGTQTDFVQDKRAYIAPALTWQPSDDTTLTLLSHFSYRDSGNPNVDLPAVGTLLPNPNGQIGTGFYNRDKSFDKFKRTEASIGYQFAHRFTDAVQVRQNFRYLHADLDEDLIGTAMLESDLRTLDRYAFRARASVDTLTVDNQAEVKFATGALQHKVLFGVDYLHSIDRWAEYDADSVAPIDLYNPVYGISVALPDEVSYSVKHPLDQIGVYIQDQAQFNRWVVTLSGRQDWSTTKTIDRLSGDKESNDADKFTYRAGLVYLFDNGFAPYVSYSTSFQPGLGTTFDGSALKPTTGRSVEAGVKYQPRGQKSFVMASVYDIRQNNIVEPDPAHPQGNFSTQVGEQHVRGVELSATADLGSGLNAVAAYTYMDGTIDDDNLGISNNQAPDVPHHMASLWIDKTFQRGWLSGFGVGGGVRYIGPRYGDEDNQLRLPSNTLADATVHYDIDHWRFSLNAQNLLDRIYVGGCQRSNYCSYGLRRTVLARATYYW